LKHEEYENTLSLYDKNEDGELSPDEMQQYLDDTMVRFNFSSYYFFHYNNYYLTFI